MEKKLACSVGKGYCMRYDTGVACSTIQPNSMKKLSIFWIGITVVILASCRGGENKADNDVDTYNKERSSSDKIADPSVSSAPAAAPEDSMTAVPGNNEILARIDRYLVSKPEFTADGEGINNIVVTVKNALPNITFQKAIVEVSLLSTDGKVLRNDFYPIQNIEPGDTETIKIPASSKASSVVSHVVKVKSNTLTNGEMVLVGTHFEPGK